MSKYKINNAHDCSYQPRHLLLSRIVKLVNKHVFRAPTTFTSDQHHARQYQPSPFKLPVSHCSRPGTHFIYTHHSRPTQIIQSTQTPTVSHRLHLKPPPLPAICNKPSNTTSKYGLIRVNIEPRGE